MKTPVAQPNSIEGQSLSNLCDPFSVQEDPLEYQVDARVVDPVADEIDGQDCDWVDPPIDAQERAGRVVRKALLACPDLGEDSPARGILWLAVQDQICTRAPKMVKPFGSNRPILVTQEYATDELIMAMDWLSDHGVEARTYSPLHLFVMLRGVATRSSGGSARAAQADSLCGITEVPQGCSLTRSSADEVDAA